MDIATECGLPKELLQRMQLLKVLAAKPLKLEYDAFAEVHEENFFINDNLNNILISHSFERLFPLANSASGKEILFLFELEFDIYDSKIECHNRIHRVY
jgi:hypothetical protein